MDARKMLFGMDLIEAIRKERSKPPSGIKTLKLDKTHSWITQLRPGFAQMDYEVDPRYQNLEGAVICSWIAALIDQVLFFASNSVCETGEATRMNDLRVSYLRNVSVGTIRFSGSVLSRNEDHLHCRCEVRDLSGELYADATAIIAIVAPP